MIISNEPGYYAAGAFGIRIENLLVVEERAIAGGERPMLGFETLTFAPIDLSLIEPKLMDADEIAWLDDYHARVRKTLSPRVDRLNPPLAREGDAATRARSRLHVSAWWRVALSDPSEPARKLASVLSDFNGSRRD